MTTPRMKMTPARERMTRRKAAMVSLIEQGLSIKDALRHEDVGVTDSAYRRWRSDDHRFAINMDSARNLATRNEESDSPWEHDHQLFAKRYFGMEYAEFQLEYLHAIQQMEGGDMLLVLWPPDHGKTTCFENYASEKLALDPTFRFCIASEGFPISKKILKRIRDRMDLDSSLAQYVADYGPFRMPSAAGGIRQTWSAGAFDVWKKRQTDERDYSVMAIGRGASIVSTRTDHLHIDDIQSTKTIDQTNDIETWLRQDALSRPGENGITTIVGTRVGPHDIYRQILNDTELLDSGILKVLKFPAIRKDEMTGKESFLWPERYSERSYGRMKIKAGADAWARNYMQEDGDERTERNFTTKRLDEAKAPLISMQHDVPKGSSILMSLDPALGGWNSVMACEATATGKLVVRRIREITGLVANEQIMDEVLSVIKSLLPGGDRNHCDIVDLIIEAMNFQKGLANDERLLELCDTYGIEASSHLTGNNKYDPDIGISSMAYSFKRGEIILPWADDEETRREIAELIKQLKEWKPGIRGKDQRMDRLMTLWFIWIKWQARRKRPTAKKDNANKIQRSGASWSPNRSGLLLPSTRFRRAG
jgi:hypothetical protein